MDPTGQYRAGFCDCERGKHDHEENTRQLAGALEWHERALKAACIPSRFAKASLWDFSEWTGDPDDPECKDGPIVDNVYEWATAKGRGALFIWGNVGAGKTHLACSAADLLLGEALRTRFWVTSELLNCVQRGYGAAKPSRASRVNAHLFYEANEETEDDAETLWKHAMDWEALVLDDLATEYVTEWVKAQLYLLINHRYNSELRTVVTSNLDPQKLSERIGDRTVSRLMHGATVIHLTGKDRRLASE